MQKRIARQYFKHTAILIFVVLMLLAIVYWVDYQIFLKIQNGSRLNARLTLV